jgi:hypothetical protein
MTLNGILLKYYFNELKFQTFIRVLKKLNDNTLKIIYFTLPAIIFFNNSDKLKNFSMLNIVYQRNNFTFLTLNYIYLNSNYN